MHTPASNLPVLFEAGPAVIRGADWGGQRALFITLAGGTDATPLLQGLPDNRCPCPHWGYVRSGRLRVVYADRTESFAAGDLYYMPSGHTIMAEEDVELIEFSPPAEYDEVIATLRRNAGV